MAISRAQTRKVSKVLSEYKKGRLRSGSKSGRKVTDRKQAVEIASSEDRRAAKRKS